MPGLREVAEAVFGRKCVATGLSITESNRTFSLRKNRNEKAVAVLLQRCSRWPASTKRADGLFICLPADSRMFLVVLVELKGGHVQKAIEQLTSSARVLCKNSTNSLSPHNNQLGEWIAAQRPHSHTARVLGVIVAKRSLPQAQDKRKGAMISRGLKIVRKSTPQLVTTMTDMLDWINPER